MNKWIQWRLSIHMCLLCPVKRDTCGDDRCTPRRPVKIRGSVWSSSHPAVILISASGCNKMSSFQFTNMTIKLKSHVDVDVSLIIPYTHCVRIILSY